MCIIDWNTLELKEKSARVTSALSFDSSILEKMKIMESINSRIDRSSETAYDNRNDGTQISNNVVNSGPNSATDHYDCIEKAKERKILKNPGHIVYDVIIGSDLVYCESDTAGISKVVRNYLAENGIFIFVIPKPSHRYGTEHLIPVLLNDGFEIYSWCVADDKCTSSEVNAADGSKNKKCWISARTNNCLDSNWRDDFLHQNVIFSDILKKLIVDDHYLVCDLDESPFTAWNLIIGHRHR